MVRDDFQKLAALILNERDDALFLELDKLGHMSRPELSQLLLYLAPLGGVGWPTKLCSLGADVNAIGDEGETALSQCIHGAGLNEDGTPGHKTFETAIELLALGADPNGSYMSCFSLVHLATLGNQPDFAVLLLLAGASLDKEEPDRFTTATLRDCMRSAADASPALRGRAWPRQIVELVDR